MELGHLTRRERALLLCGVVAGPFFFVTFTVVGAAREDYSALRHPISSLEIGPDGWMQSVNFVLTGALVSLFGWGLRCCRHRLSVGRVVPILIMAVGLGLIGAGFVAPDPLSGYPAGTPPTAPAPSLHRVLHDLFSTPVFTALPAAAAILAHHFATRRMLGWAWYCAVSAAVMVMLFVTTSVAFAQGTVLTQVGGLLQRLTLAIGFAWMAVLSWWAAGSATRTAPARSDRANPSTA